MSNEDLHFLKPSTPQPVMPLGSLMPTMIEATYYSIKQPPTFRELFDAIHKVEVKLREQGLHPTTIVCGSDMFLVLRNRMEEFIRKYGDFNNRTLLPGEEPISRDIFRGMAITCDPYLEPIQFRVLPTSEECCWQAAKVREINEG